MNTKEKLEKLTDEDFQMYLGVKRKTFYASLEVLENQSAIEHKHGGKPIKTSVFDRLVITLNYYCEDQLLITAFLSPMYAKSSIGQRMLLLTAVFLPYNQKIVLQTEKFTVY